jgi:benzoyl-CoA reductase/2-hydroxyglutaryl-CoA dehydratase subunit BcrC/BadD/HgdB
MKPESLAIFDKFSERSLAGLDAAQEAGIKIAGYYCIFVPTELIRAAGAIPVALCGKKQEPISKAEEILPANLCPLIKSSYGYAVTATCPFFDFSDFIIGETTCDGKKKMFELLGRIKPLHLMHLPYTRDQAHALTFWYEEILRFKSFLENQTGNSVQLEELKFRIRQQNEIRRLFQKIISVYRDNGAPISGLDLLPVLESKSFCVDPLEYIQHLEKIATELTAMKDAGYTAGNAGAPRILLTGTPAGRGSEKVLKLIEELGGLVVCQENCTGIKNVYDFVDEEESDPYMALARRYLSLPCSCMTPNQGRIDRIGGLIEELNIQGVVDLSWQCCHTYNVEAYTVRQLVEDEYGLAFLHIETDYSDSDIEQLKTRVEAFLETVVSRP